MTTYVVVNKSGQSIFFVKNILSFEKGFFFPRSNTLQLKTKKTDFRGISNYINQFYAITLLLQPLKTSEYIWFSDVFRGYRKKSAAWKRLRMIGTVRKLSFF